MFSGIIRISWKNLKNGINSKKENEEEEAEIERIIYINILYFLIKTKNKITNLFKESFCTNPG
jgi:hypothetical protein